MAQAPTQPAPLDKVIDAVGAVASNRGLVGVGMLFLLLCFFFTLVFVQGPARWIFGGISLAGILITTIILLIAIRKDADMPKIPYQHEYLMELLNRGYFYGDPTNLVKLQDSDGMPLRINEEAVLSETSSN